MTPDPMSRPPRRAMTGAVIGFLSVAVFLAVAQLASLFSGRSSAPVLAIGETFVDHTPLALREFAVRNFRTNDKLVLIVGIFVVIALVAVGVGVAAMRHPEFGTAGIVALAVIAGFAAHGRPDADGAAPLPAPLPAVAGAVAALIAFRLLLRAAAARSPRLSLDAFAAQAMSGEAQPDAVASTDRRRFLVASGGVAATAVVAGAVGATGSRSGAAAIASRAAVVIPVVAATTPSAAATATAPLVKPELAIPGLSPFFTPNNDFYRIDTALRVPEIDATKWSLRIHGMVDKELRLSFADLRAMPAVENDVTLCCVSNPVGGPYISNARWTGVLLADVLAKAGVHKDATQVFSTSADGWTCGSPTSVILDGRAAMLAYGMNGEALPIPHGFPVRLVVPGLYGYVSATKWVTDIELTTMDKQGYWMPRGWSQLGPVKTQSRIDVPSGRKPTKAGLSPIAGVAWSQHKGIAKVEISIDNGPWLETKLAGEDVTDTWRQWMYEGWQATKGSHGIRVRATDKTGYVQTADVVDVAPDGATGYHEVAVNVS